MGHPEGDMLLIKPSMSAARWTGRISTKTPTRVSQSVSHGHQHYLAARHTSIVTVDLHRAEEGRRSDRPEWLLRIKDQAAVGARDPRRRTGHRHQGRPQGQPGC